MFLSDKLIITSYKELNNLTDQIGKKATEITSALRYLAATSSMIKKKSLSAGLNLSISNDENRNEFIKEVGNVVSITPSVYTNNFLFDFQDNSDYAVRSNFLTTRLKYNGDYPGRPASLFVIEDETINFHPQLKSNLKNHFHNFDNVKCAFALWLIRNDDIGTASSSLKDIVADFNKLLKSKYENILFSVLKIEEAALDNLLKKYTLTIKDLFSTKKYDFVDFMAKINYKSSGASKKTTSATGTSKAINLVFYGPPGTGKSFAAEKFTDPYIVSGKNNIRKITFHPEYDYYNFVGSFKPVSDETDKIKYQFSPQIFTKIYVDAWLNPDTPYFLIIEEINRGNCAQIFGDLFQLLDRNDAGLSNYSIDAEHEHAHYLKKALGENHEGIQEGKLTLPNNLSLIATMNTSDQSLYPMDSAFKRRWDWEYIPINYSCKDSNFIISLENGNKYDWLNFLEVINQRIYQITGNQDKQIGNWFVSSSGPEKIVSEKTLINKVLFYLWNDVFKDEEESVFKIENVMYNYQSFFENNKSSELIEKLLNSLSLSPIKK